MYAKAGLVDCSAKVFDEMAHGDQFSWCGLISGHVRHGFDLEAYGLFRRMIEMGHKPKHFVLSSVLKACSASGILELGVLVHSFALKSGLDFDRFVEVGLVSMYAKCGALDDAVKVFYEIPIKNSVSWNTIISGNALISMCIRNGELEEAYEIFLEMPERDAISWTAIMAGLANEYRFKEALETFQAFRKTEMQVDQHSATVAISVCTSLRDIDKGRQIHALSLKMV
ncbi:hypothetical protein HPP92_009887 [Vanilla planifolia]|uniref:Pentatricopeptide repeat-containing protein n=1 Tax=Vanilla planifolia TaxID=51239 RepID=A0A835RG81_VANPL|nr:hypothetical protein HPP92_009887 [Vanilla planifolia]